jgi:hypothetical protein
LTTCRLAGWPEETEDVAGDPLAGREALLELVVRNADVQGHSIGIEHQGLTGSEHRFLEVAASWAATRIERGLAAQGRTAT